MKIFSFILTFCLFFYAALWWGCTSKDSPKDRITPEVTDEVGSDEDDDDDSYTPRRRRRRGSSSYRGGSSSDDDNNDDTDDGNNDENGNDNNNDDDNNDEEDDDNDDNEDDEDEDENDDEDDNEDNNDDDDDDGDTRIGVSNCPQSRLPASHRKCNTRISDGSERFRVHRRDDCRGNLMYLCNCPGSTVTRDCGHRIPDWLCASDSYGGDFEVQSNGYVIARSGAFVQGTWEGPGEWRVGRFQCSIWKSGGGTFKNGYFRDSLWEGRNADWERGCIEENGRTNYRHELCGSDGRKCVCP